MALKLLINGRNTITIIIIVSFIIICSIAIAILIGNYKPFDIIGTSITLSFIGILATFIVVNNTLQVKNIEDKINKHISAQEEFCKYIEDFKNNYMAASFFAFRNLAIMDSAEINKTSFIRAIYFCFEAISYYSKCTRNDSTLDLTKIIVCLDNWKNYYAQKKTLLNIETKEALRISIKIDLLLKESGVFFTQEHKKALSKIKHEWDDII